MGLILPWWAKWVAAGALAAALFGFGWFKGSEHWHGVLIDERAKALTEGVRITGARKDVTVQVITRYLPAAAQQQVVTQIIEKEVVRYVPADTPPLPAGFRVLHDAAATGSLPGATPGADAGPVPAQEATATITANYGTCRADQLRLQYLQEWVTKQGKVR